MIELERMMMVTNVVIPVIIAIILVFGLIGNALVVYVTIITKRTAKHPIHSLFVLNLAAADVLFLLVCAPYRVSYHIQLQLGGYTFCLNTATFFTVTVANIINTIFPYKCYMFKLVSPKLCTTRQSQACRHILFSNIS